MNKIDPQQKKWFLLYMALPIVILSSFSLSTNAQRKYGNEWINYGQPYYKLKVLQSGIYRISYTDLQNAGVNVSTLNPTHLQLFFRGAETPIYVSSGAKTSFGASDYIEFYGQGNDGALDSVLYLNPANDINKSYSMYTDTAAYFLTVGTGTNNLRYTYTDKKYGNNPQSLYTCEQDLNLHSNYNLGVPVNSSLNFYGSDYVAGTGWMGGGISTTNYGNTASQAFNISLNNSYTPADTTNLPKPQLEILVYGNSDVANQNPDHHLVIIVQPSNNKVFDTTYNGFQTIHKTLKRYWSDVFGKSNVSYVIEALGVKPSTGASTSDVEVPSFLRLRYLNTFGIDPNNPYLAFGFQNHSGSPQTDFNFSAATAPSTATNLVLYDLTNFKRTNSFQMTGKNVTFGIDNENDSANYILYDTTQALKALSITAVNFVQPDTGYNYIIVTNKKFAQGAQAFATYKNTQIIDSAGDPFKTQIVYSDDLYDEFFYGVHHPAAIQNCMAYLYNTASQKPQYLMLLGKGIDNVDARNPYYFGSDYVPSIGNPPSDVMFTAGINIGFQGLDKVIDPKMGIGRLQILSNNDILTYLNKLEQYDANIKNELPYLKTATNVDGGDNDQIEQIRTFMDGEAVVLSKPNTGLKVNSFYSVSNTAVNNSLEALIQQNIQQGTSLFSYLAHGAAEQLQVDIADTTTLNNKGHYPIMYLNGCELGNAFLPPGTSTYGGFYTLAGNKGAIIWLSHSNQALDDVLYSEMGAFFNNVAVGNYGKSIGSTWRKSITDLKTDDGDDEYRALLYEWVIQGDPSVMFPYLSKPDYAVYDSSLFMVPGTISTSASYQVAIPVTNLGKTNPSLIKVEVKQTLPDNSVHIFDSMIPPVNYIDTIYFTINRNNLNIQGINKFDIYVNADSAIQETSYANNHASFSYYFQGNSVRALFPTNYNIVNTDTPDLMSQSRNLQDYKTGIYFEIDTTTRFNSPLKQTSPLLNGSSLITWQPKLNNIDGSGNLIDSTVYYWRTRMNLPIDTGGEWDIQSFIYLKNGHPGWSQSNWGQYGNIVPDLVNIDTIGRIMTYPPKYQGYTLTMTAFNKDGLGIKSNTGLIYTYGTSGSTTLAMVIVDKNTLNPLAINPLTHKPMVIYNYSNNGITYPVLPVNYLQFDMTDSYYRDTFAMVINAVPNGDYVLLSSIPNRGGIQDVYDYGASVLQAFAEVGDTMMHSIKRDSVAFVIAGKKGNVKGTLLAEAYKYDTWAKYISGNDPGDTVIINPVLQGILLDSASIMSQQIGPASNWREMYQDYRSLEYPTSDQAYMSVHGIDKNGNDTVLYDTIKADSFDISKINAQQYPYLKLQAFLNDTLNWVPPQLRLWQAEYDGIPEGTIIGDSTSIYPKTVYAQGDSVHVKIKFQNISNFPMTKVLVTFTINDAQNSTKVNDSVFYPPLNPGQYFWIDKEFPITNLSGTNYLTIFANPGFQQPELTLDNNYIQFTFLVSNDKINPLMDVTFDGLHITDGQIVSPTPDIVVSVRDENQLLILNDTADYKISLQYPDSLRAENVYFSNPKVTFLPGDTTDNNSIINYRPGPLAAGIYLFSAQATDISGNLSGPTPYTIHFKVVSQPAVSNFYLYPNPLTNVSIFGFTITGTEIPQMMEIKIYDLTGRCVKTLNLAGSGNLRAGVNEISWDGTDDNGAVLSQGIYIYKTIVRLNGSQPQNYPLPEDGQLEQGYGKIMILREQ